MALIAFIFLTILFFSLSLFFGLELLKKFEFMNEFIMNSNQVVTWHYAGSVGKKGQMGNIVLRGKRKFCALVGFRLDIPIIKYSGYDHFNVVQSDENGVAVISGWLGKSSFELQFLINTEASSAPIVVTSTEEDQKLLPQIICKPHWWQRLGYYG